MAYFKNLLKEFDKGGLRNLRSMHKSEISLVIDDYFHPNEVSIEQVYCYYTDLLSNKLRDQRQKGLATDTVLHHAKEIRLLSHINKAECIDLSDFYGEILGMSTKETSISENVSIPDINKRKL